MFNCYRFEKKKQNRYLLINPPSVTKFYIFSMIYMSSMYIKGGMGMKRFITRASGNTISKG